MQLLFQNFYEIDVDQMYVQKLELSQDLQDFLQEYMAYCQQDEKKEEYEIMEPYSESMEAIQSIFRNPTQEEWDLQSHDIVTSLLECEKESLAKIYPSNLDVKRGCCVQALFQIESDQYQYLIAKVEYDAWLDGHTLQNIYGFSKEKKKAWKMALIDTSLINGHVFIEKIQGIADRKSSYWFSSFLNMQEKRNDAKNTYRAYRALDQELKTMVEAVSPRDYVLLKDEIQKTMRKPQDISYTNYVDTLVDSHTFLDPSLEPEVIKEALEVLPQRKKFDPVFKVDPQSVEKKRTKKYKLSQGIELCITSEACDFSSKIISTMSHGKKILQIECEDEQVYASFIEEEH